MSIEQGLVQLVQGDLLVSSIACAGGGYPGALPPNQILPSWTYAFVGGAVEHTLQSERGPRGPRIQIDCYGNTAAESFSLAAAIDKVLDGFSGNIYQYFTSPPMLLACVLSCLLEQEPQDVYDGPTRSYRRILEYDLFYQET